MACAPNPKRDAKNDVAAVEPDPKSIAEAVRALFPTNADPGPIEIDAAVRGALTLDPGAVLAPRWIMLAAKIPEANVLMLGALDKLIHGHGADVKLWRAAVKAERAMRKTLQADAEKAKAKAEKK